MNKKEQSPLSIAVHFFRWYCDPHMLPHIEGDLIEKYREALAQTGRIKANFNFIVDVLLLFRPGIIRPLKINRNTNHYDMLQNHLKIGIRNVIKHKAFSMINVTGLATGMTVAILIALWISDELSFNKYHENYSRIARVEQHLNYNGVIGTQWNLPFPVGNELREKYGSDFKYVVQSSYDQPHILSAEDKNFTRIGMFMSPEAPKLLTLKILSGTRDGLTNQSSIMISQSVARTYFGDLDPIGKTIRIDSKLDVSITAVYEDIPYNSDFRDVQFIAPWDLYVTSNNLEGMAKYWDWNGWVTYVQLADGSDINSVSNKIRSLSPKKDNPYKPIFFLDPMSLWHLHSNFDNGVCTGGGIEFVWLFGIIGLFVLLLACINFMNLSTARSEKRAKEVGIRKSIGSKRSQLIAQFFSESLIIVTIAFVIAFCAVQLALPLFNQVADKRIAIPWSNPIFWISCVGFSLVTGIIAGSYPAFYLSSFKPIKALKGKFKVGRFAAAPRRVLVVTQFSVSVILIVGTIVVFQQIQYAKDRPLGFNPNHLIMVEMMNHEIHNHADAVRSELKATGAVVEMAEGSGPVAQVWSTNGNIVWEGKDPNLAADFPNTTVTQEYGRAVGWEFIDGRDFSSEFASDSSAFIISESAADFMGMKNPVGEILKWADKPYRIIGVIKDMVLSPYDEPRPSMYHMGSTDRFTIIKLNPAIPTATAVAKIESIFLKYNPTAPFDYKFVDSDYAMKFGNEERIGKLASFFALLAILISCLGVFGLVSFVAERRTKEIGIRKILGASVIGIWQMISKEFVIMVLVSFAVAVPISWYFLHDWLLRFQYRSEITWWMYAVTGVGTLAITLLTVSFQAIKVAVSNPVKSLRSE